MYSRFKKAIAFLLFAGITGAALASDFPIGEYDRRVQEILNTRFNRMQFSGEKWFELTEGGPTNLHTHPTQTPTITFPPTRTPTPTITPTPTDTPVSTPTQTPTHTPYHNQFAGKQGGDGADQYYHFNASEHTEISGWLDNVILFPAGHVDLGSGELETDGTIKTTDAYLLGENAAKISETYTEDILSITGLDLHEVFFEPTTTGNLGTIMDFIVRGYDRQGRFYMLDQDQGEWLIFTCNNGVGIFDVRGSSPQYCSIIGDGNIPVYLFESCWDAGSGVDRRLRIYGGEETAEDSETGMYAEAGFSSQTYGDGNFHLWNGYGDVILSPGAVDGLIAYSDGAIDTSLQSASRAYRDTVQAIPDATETTVVFTTEEYDTQGEYSTSTGRFTAERDGIYSVKAQVHFVSNAWVANEYIYLRLYKNTTAYTYLDKWKCQANVTTTIGVTGATDIELSAGDYIRVAVYQGSGGNLNVIADQHWNWFCVHKEN